MKIKKKTSRAGVHVSSTRPSAGSTAARSRVSRKTQSERPPRTAYDLCELVAQHIETDPLRYDQSAWGWEGMHYQQMPMCGTVCCRAGWIVALHDGPAALKDERVHISSRSDLILGLDGDQTAEIYYDGERLLAFQQGTKKYAQAGAAGLRDWAKRHEAELKARLLKDVPKLEGR